jgi:hypothetical protein
MLKVGLLWFDDDSRRALAAKLDEAAARYEERFGVQPTLVHVNPAQAEGLKHRRLRVFGDAGLRRNYFLVGVDEAEAPAEQRAAASPIGVAAAEDEARPARQRAARPRSVPSLAAVSSRHPRTRRRVS